MAAPDAHRVVTCAGGHVAEHPLPRFDAADERDVHAEVNSDHLKHLVDDVGHGYRYCPVWTLSMDLPGSLPSPMRVRT